VSSPVEEEEGRSKNGLASLPFLLYPLRVVTHTHTQAYKYTHRDYRPMEHLDAYDARGIDEEEQEELNEDEQIAARQAAEAQLERRDRREGVRTGRALPAALAGGEWETHADS